VIFAFRLPRSFHDELRCEGRIKLIPEEGTQSVRLGTRWSYPLWLVVSNPVSNEKN
jgi:hypothetical protein